MSAATDAVADAEVLKQVAEAATLRIAKLDVRPGDVLIIQPTEPVSVNRLAQFAEGMKRFLPEVRTIVVAHDIKFTLMTRAELDAQSAIAKAEGR